MTNQFHYSNWWLDEIAFEDEGPSINILTMQFTTHGTSAGETITGIDGGASEDDILFGYGGNDTLTPGDGNDELHGGEGDDTLHGHQGDDIFFYESGHDFMTDSTGTDILDIDAAYALSELAFRRYTTAIYDLVIEMDGNNSITLDDQFRTAAGEWETLRMHDGSGDIAFTNIVVETFGTASNNTIQGISVGASINDIMYGLGGNDTLYGNYGNDTLHGGDGNDNLQGYDGNDVIYGGDGDDLLYGQNDDDVLYGEAGDDDLYGHGGDDLFVYSEGLDTVSGGAGTDTLHITGSVTINDMSIADYLTFDAKIVITASTDEIVVKKMRYYGNSEFETLRFDDGFETDQLPDYNNWYWGTASGETLTGTSDDNVLIGLDGADTIDAGDGADDAHGGDGADTLNGEDGDDLLHGGDGDDLLYGGDGLDTLFGGADADTFAFEAASAFNDQDVVRDFSSGDSDVIDIEDVLDGYYTHGVDDITDFVQITDDGTDSTLAIDQDGTANGSNFVAVATILGATGLTDEASLESGGVLVTH
jgi:Ca2+-binding RTX toxin-like protein